MAAVWKASTLTLPPWIWQTLQPSNLHHCYCWPKRIQNWYFWIFLGGGKSLFWHFWGKKIQKNQFESTKKKVSAFKWFSKLFLLARPRNFSKIWCQKWILWLLSFKNIYNDVLCIYISKVRAINVFHILNVITCLTLQICVKNIKGDEFPQNALNSSSAGLFSNFVRKGKSPGQSGIQVLYSGENKM